jgi:predicted ATPase
MHLKNVTLHPEQYPTREHYPFNLSVFHQTERVAFDAPVTLFVGENGTGKSTLLEALAHACGIHIWRYDEGARFEVNPYEGRFCNYLTVEWANGRVPGSYFGSAIFQHFCQILDEWAATDPGQLRYFGGKSLVTQSHGQSLMSFFRARYQIKGLYLLDEPETALSPKSQLELLDILTRMSEAGHAQFIVATHSPILLACPGAVIYSFDSVPIQPVRYEQTTHYQIYANFLSDRSKYFTN